MTMMTRAIALRPMLPSDTPALILIARDAIDELAADDYDAGQRNAWSEALKEGFLERVAGALVLVATIDRVPVGFASLVGDSHVDMLYVDPRAARGGVGNTLCDALEKLAAARGVKALTVDASDAAKALFDTRGYVSLRRNTVPLDDYWLANTSMQKTLVREASNDP